MIVDIACGSGGQATADLIGRVFAGHLAGPALARREDAAVLALQASDAGARLALTTDSYVVTPLFFKGGDIGKLAVCGTLNDLAVMGASPRWITAGFIIETGIEEETLERVARSMGEAARAAGVEIAAADTKVIAGSGGLYVNTAGVGMVPAGRDVGASKAAPGDSIVVSGPLGAHHAAILSARMNIENGIESDCADLSAPLATLFADGVPMHVLRDVTRGGLGTVVAEIAAASGAKIVLDEAAIPVEPAVAGFCEVLGLDPLYMGNEGRVAVFTPSPARVLELFRRHALTRNARVVGRVLGPDADQPAGTVVMETAVGGRRRIGPLVGEGLPRIC